jgi:DNA-directed RNA polymerase subunit beta
MGVGADDIDHLRNKRVRAVGELLQNQLRGGMLRMERVARERLTSLDRESVTAQAVISIKPITAAVRSFFGSGQLSQFMEQTNPSRNWFTSAAFRCLGRVV